MTYCTSTKVSNYLIGYNFGNTATSTIVTDSIIDATNEINKYLSDRYDITTWATSTPPMISSLCKWMAAGYSIEAVSRGDKHQLARAKELLSRSYENLKALADGSAHLVNTAGVSISESNSNNDVISTTSEYSDTFNEGKSIYWKADPVKLSDISKER